MADIVNDPNVANSEQTFSMAELEAAGLSPDQLKGITAKVKELQEKGKNYDGLASAIGDLVKTQKEFTDAMAKAVADRNAEVEANKFEAASKDAFVKRFSEVKDKDPKEAQAIFEAMSKQYGEATTDLVLNGNELRKMLERPIYKGTDNVDKINAFRYAWDNAYLLAAAWDGVKSHSRGGDRSEIDWEVMKDANKVIARNGLPGTELVERAINQAMDTLTATEGAEWLPTAMSGNLGEELYLSLRVASLFPRINMPSKTIEWPIRTSRSLGYRMAEATTNSQFFSNLATAHSMNTGKLSMSAQKLATLNFISDELDEDAILPMLQLIREDVIWGLNYAIEDAVINGDTGATLDGSLWTGTTDARSTWNGIRKSVNTAEKTDLSTFNLSALRNLRKPMGKHSVDPNELFYVVSPQTHIELLKLAEVITLEKYGPQATVRTGEIGRLDGIPIIISPLIYTNLNASGVYDGTTTTKTCMLLVKRDSFLFGDRRTVRVESERNALAGQRFVLATWRGDFRKAWQSSEPVVALGYNMTP